jgi:hypothetical protein
MRINVMEKLCAVEKVRTTSIIFTKPRGRVKKSGCAVDGAGDFVNRTQHLGMAF